MSRALHCYLDTDQIAAAIPLINSEEQVIGDFSSGKLPFGVIWKAVSDSLRNLVEECNKMKQIVFEADSNAEKIDKEILNTSATIQELQAQLEQLKKKKKENAKSAKLVKNKLAEYKAYIDENYKEDQRRVEIAASVEAVFMQKIEKQLSHPSSFSCCMEGDNLPLGTYLSLMGVPAVEIASMSDVDGEEFLFSGEKALYVDTAIETKKIISYAHLFLKDRLFLSSHTECSVCDCTTNKELDYLLKEHQISIGEDNLLMYKKLNGPQSLCIDRRDVAEFEKEQQIKLSHQETMKTIRYLRNIHQQEISSSINQPIGSWGNHNEIVQKAATVAEKLAHKTPLKFIFEWGLSNNVITNGKVFKGNGASCNHFRFARSSVPMKRNTYAILKWSMNPCYGAIGLATSQFNGVNTRLGMDQNSWAIRIYGPHNSTEFNGAWHNGNYEKTPDITQKEITITYTRSGDLHFHSNSDTLLHTFENLPKTGDLYLYAFVCSSETMEIL